jgi:hypothetical protein
MVSCMDWSKVARMEGHRSHDAGKGMSRLSGNSEQEPPPVSDRALAVFFLILATALVLGYLLLNKLVDISREEDCALAHRRNCGASDVTR